MIHGNSPEYLSDLLCGVDAAIFIPTSLFYLMPCMYILSDILVFYSHLMLYFYYYFYLMVLYVIYYVSDLLHVYIRVKFTTLIFKLYFNRLINFKTICFLF